MKHKAIIEQAGKLIHQSELGRLRSITGAWNDVKWEEIDHAQGLAAPHDRKPEIINIFGDFYKVDQSKQLEVIVAAFGVSAFIRLATKEAQHRWEFKLTLPESAQVESVQEKLRDPKFKTFREIMESFTTLMDRYVALNLTNALLANGITRERALNLNLRQWGSTLEYANIRKMHSLKPYVTAYGPRDVAECPGDALAEKLVHQMGHVTESSLAKAYGRLIIEVFTLCRE
jgi:hypothetical protein